MIVDSPHPTLPPRVGIERVGIAGGVAEEYKDR
jgi:hypothetical protein